MAGKRARFVGYYKVPEIGCFVIRLLKHIEMMLANCKNREYVATPTPTHLW